MDKIGCILSVFVHTVNIHYEKVGLNLALKAHQIYLEVRKFCADAGYKRRFQDELLKPKIFTYIPPKFMAHKWNKLPNR